MKKITTTYSSGHQSFRRVTREGGETFVSESSFKIPEKKQVLNIDEEKGTTICTLDDGSVGTSKCMNNDVYDGLKGIKIAYLRAKIKSLQKELDALVE